MNCKYGMYIFPKDVLDVYRKAVDREKQGKTLVDAIDHAEAAGLTISGSGEYSRVPTGYDKDHPRGALLKKKGLVTISSGIEIDVITSPALVDVCMQYAKAILPLHQWLVTMQKGAAATA